MTPTRFLLSTTAAGSVGTIAATLVARHWRNRHRALRGIYWEATDERDEMRQLLVDLAAAVADKRIPIIPPGYAAALRLIADPDSCPTCGEAPASPRKLDACDGSGPTVCVDPFHRGPLVAAGPSSGKNTAVPRWIKAKVTAGTVVTVEDPKAAGEWAR